MPRLLLPAARRHAPRREPADGGGAADRVRPADGCPWGVSESAFGAVDAALNYQYQAFGVPGLGLKRGLGKDLVIAPYADRAGGHGRAGGPRQFRRMADEGAEGDHGFYEAIDYTADRLDRPQEPRIVKCFMAHHQGMSLIAIAGR